MYATLHADERLDAARRRAERPAAAPGEPLPALEHQVCAEAGIWAPDAARRAIAQARGDVPRAVALVKVWAATLTHLPVPPVRAEDVHLTRRLSPSHAGVPGGQWLGDAPELAGRLLRWDDGEDPGPGTDDADAVQSRDGGEPARTDGADAPGTPDHPDAPARSQVPRVRNLLASLPTTPTRGGDGADPAESSLVAPYGRPTRLGLLARAETAGLMSFASIVLAGRREAVLTEVTAQVVGVRVPHPRTGEACVVAEVPVAEAEAVLDADVENRPGIALGWGATLGTLERRAVAMALLDAAMEADGEMKVAVTLDEQSVVAATDGSATNGFVEHLRLPHYASFASYVSQVRRQNQGTAS